MSEQKRSLLKRSACKNNAFTGKCLPGLPFLRPPLQLHKLLVEDYKRAVRTLLLLHIKPAALNLSNSQRDWAMKT